MAGALQQPVVALRAELAKANQELADHAEDWAMCGIAPGGQLSRLLVLSDANRKLKAALAGAEAECADLRRKAVDLESALVTANRSADDQMQQKRTAQRALQELDAEHDRMKDSLILILRNTDAVNAIRHQTVPEMLACMLMKTLREVMADAKSLCKIIDHADPSAWNNGNTHPDSAGTDEGAVLMHNRYEAIRVKYQAD